MARGYHYLLLLVLLAGSSWAAQSAQIRITESILKKLKNPESYDPAIRPTTRDGGPSKVEIQTFFRDIDIDDVNMVADFDITFRMIWTDNRLIYSESSGVEYVTILDTKLLWLPDAFFKNAVVTQRYTIHPETYLRIYPTGRIVYSTRLALKQGCPMNLARFPHDVQKCYVKIASYGYTTKDIDFMFAEEDSVSISPAIHAARFDFEGHESEYCNSVTSTGEYSCVSVGMKIRRVFGSYLMDWYIPTMFLVVVAWFSFLVPQDIFLGRLLLTLLPPLALASFSHDNRVNLASVPYVRAQDIFTGISLCIMFLTLVYVIICQVMSNKKSGKDEEEKATSAEDGEVKPSRRAESKDEGGLKGLFNRLMKRGSYFSRLAIFSAYGFFLFVYFVAYCGTG